MKLNIIRPESKKTLDISWIEVNTFAGNFIIQPNHAPTILILKQGEPIIYSLSSGEKKIMTAKEGIIEVTRTLITLLINE